MECRILRGCFVALFCSNRKGIRGTVVPWMRYTSGAYDEQTEYLRFTGRRFQTGYIELEEREDMIVQVRTRFDRVVDRIRRTWD